MFTIYVTKKNLPTAIRSAHAKKVNHWKKNGSKGLKPKLYETAESVVEAGLVHIESSVNHDASSESRK